MSGRDEIAEFVRTGLSAGQPADALAAALGSAGWSPNRRCHASSWSGDSQPTHSFIRFRGWAMRGR